MTMRYRSKPSEIEAVQWTGDNADEVYRFVQVAEGIMEREVFCIDPVGSTGRLLAGANGAQGMVEVPVGHWIVRQPGVHTDHWPVDPDYFASKYEPVET